jgi:hypothetical protein
MLKKPSRWHLAQLTALPFAMLSACATSPDAEPSLAPDPVVETRTVTVTLCPPELLLEVPDQPPVPADATMNANDAALNWVSAVIGWGDLLAARLRDARGDCP